MQKLSVYFAECGDDGEGDVRGCERMYAEEP